jgi:TatD family-associated radical SAM protein
MDASTKTQEPALVYRYEDGLYVNLTSRCPTACKFCIKFSWDYKYRGYDLKLPGEPAVEEILAAAPADLSQFREVVFCGYGESTYRLKEMEQLSRAFRARGAKRVRLNTIGLGSLIHGRDIAPDLGRFLDAVSVSLNTIDPAKYVEVIRPLPEYRDKALPAVLDFIASCVKSVPDTTVTAVEGTAGDAAAVRRAAEERGAVFRLRPYLDDYEEK